MSKMNRSKQKLWGSGVVVMADEPKMLTSDQIKAINRGVERMAEGRLETGRDYELKEWQIDLMTSQ